jgi:hypothetical protein
MIPNDFIDGYAFVPSRRRILQPERMYFFYRFVIAWNGSGQAHYTHKAILSPLPILAQVKFSHYRREGDFLEVGKLIRRS